ncbi:hypothetical protein SAMN06313486_10160 [Epsilonproteobacteria bacterium SCGC AD-308-P11]|jgi:hypothetical protein|nr:hypothetical protein SAMN06313486_10160 [Epsilonproteobacteria bacterium SCGC AD-308-P11]
MELFTNPGILILGGIIIAMLIGIQILKNMDNPKNQH